MSIPTLTMFNCKGGVGKTTLTANVAAMMGELGYRVLVADLDPQYHLSSMTLGQEQLESGYRKQQLVFDSFEALQKYGRDVTSPHRWMVRQNVALLATDFRQSELEERLVSAWELARHDNDVAIEQHLGFRLLLEKAAADFNADVVMIDLGSQLSAMNRAILLHCTHIAIPLTANFLALQALRMLGNALQNWQSEWNSMIGKSRHSALALPRSRIKPIGYILGHIHQRGLRQTTAVQSLAEQIPEMYRRYILHESAPTDVLISQDEHCLAGIRNFHSLIQMADDARKPIFDLQPADGAIGAHGNFVQEAYKTFKNLSEKIISRIGLEK